MMRNCPQPRPLLSGQQPSRAITNMGNGNNGKERPQRGQRGNQRGRGGRGNSQPGRKVARVDDRNQYYAFPDNNKAKAYDAVVIGTILVFDQITNVLFDSGSTYSQVYVKFASYFEMMCNILDHQIRVSILVGELVIVTYFIELALFGLWDFRLRPIW